MRNNFRNTELLGKLERHPLRSSLAKCTLKRSPAMSSISTSIGISARRADRKRCNRS
jgi:hypothetical protein